MALAHASVRCPGVRLVEPFVHTTACELSLRTYAGGQSWEARMRADSALVESSGVLGGL